METPLTPLEFMRRARRVYGAREAVVDGDLRLTYAQLFDRCDRWATYLAARLGVRRGDRVAYIAPNTHAQLESFYAVPRLGAVLVPLNYRLSGDELAYCIDHSGATVVCAHADYLELVDGIRAKTPKVKHVVALEGSRAGFVDYEAAIRDTAPGAVSEWAPTDVAETELLTINYTSGTTAKPKGVMITHRNAYMNSIGTLVHVHMTPADRYLWTLPMFHANGWTFTWTVTAAGGTHVCLRRVEPPRIYEAIAAERITIFCAAPTVLIGVASAPEAKRGDVPRGLRVITAGAPPAAATIGRVEQELGWTILHVYGLTETAPFITVCEALPEHADLPPDERAHMKARQGVELVTSGELLVVDEEGNEVPHDGATPGEITVRGNAVMAGYFEDPDATATALRGGYFHSGDAAVVHPDGYIEIRDRIKDVIISGGENISSIEVEGVILQHAAVQEVAVVGVKSEKWGETPHAFVVLRKGAAATADELRAWVRDRLAHFKCPELFHFIDELPKTATGKVQKFVLRGKKSGISAQ